MHDLQTIIKLNRGPFNALTPKVDAVIRAHQIANEMHCPVCNLGVEPLDQVEYGAPETTEAA